MSYCIAKIKKHMRNWQERGISVDPLSHIAGEANITDLATLSLATADVCQEDSIWVHGPNILQRESENWPMSREFLRRGPPEEAQVVEVNAPMLWGNYQ